MSVSAQQFADLVSQELQNPERMGSSPDFGVTLLRVGSGYHLKPVGGAPSDFILECYRIVYSQVIPSETVVPPI